MQLGDDLAQQLVMRLEVGLVVYLEHVLVEKLALVKVHVLGPGLGLMLVKVMAMLLVHALVLGWAHGLEMTKEPLLGSVLVELK